MCSYRRNDLCGFVRCHVTVVIVLAYPCWMRYAILGHFQLKKLKLILICNGYYLRFFFSLQISNSRKNHSKRVYELNANNILFDLFLSKLVRMCFILSGVSTLTWACGVCTGFLEGVEDIDKSKVISCRVREFSPASKSNLFCSRRCV